MAVPNNDSFVNINLDESINISRSNNNDDNDHENPHEIIEDNDDNDEFHDSVEPSDNPVEGSNIKDNSKLDEIINKTFHDFGEYFKITPTRQINDLNETIDTLLTHMEEFCGLLELIRNGNNQNLDVLFETLESKMDHCNQLFDMIGKLERIVGRVGFEINRMEEEVTKAEAMMGSKNTIRKLLSFITSSGSSQSNARTPFIPPDIYKTSDVMQL